ncbi:MAG TPA: nitroreductase family protein [Conexivisphaerales archaeon]|nr:nitroreductase family protein [Conexivisphaerales archaeon]
MDAYQAVVSRIEVREFATKRVPRSLQVKVVNAARMAPSAYNKQLWNFVLVNDKELLAELGALSPTGRYIKDAPFAVATFVDKSYPQYSLDAMRAVQGMMIAAWGMGLGSCFVGGIDREKAAAALGAPAELYLFTITPFGYPKKKLKGRKDRKPLEEVASLNKFGNKLKP